MTSYGFAMASYAFPWFFLRFCHAFLRFYLFSVAQITNCRGHPYRDYRVLAACLEYGARWPMFAQSYAIGKHSKTIGIYSKAIGKQSETIRKP